MRKIVNLNKVKNETVRLMIYNDINVGTYLFGYSKIKDCPSKWDELYESEKEALENCESEYGIKSRDWVEIANPEPNCQDDWINPTRVKGINNGNPEFGKFEKLINGDWIELELNE